MKPGIARGRCTHGLAVATVFLGAFLLRLWASTTVPLTQDELMWIRIAEELSFQPQSLDLKGTGCNDHGSLQMYLLKASSEIFGDAPAAWRFLNVCVASLGVLGVYGLARIVAGRGPALAAMILVAVNQFHVGWSRMAMMETVFLTLATLSLILFCHALQTGRLWAVLLNGVVVGLGLLAKESMALLPISYFLFLLFTPRYRAWLRRPAVYAALLLALLTVSHEIYWNLTGQSVSMRYPFRQATQVGGISLRPVSFFLGELIEPLVGEDLWSGKNRGANVFFPGWYEWPMMHWIEGLLLLGCTVTFFRRGRSSQERLMLTVFLFGAIFTMLIYTSFLFNPFYTPSLCLVPALIFAGCRLAQACARPWGRIAVPLMLVYLAIHVVSFARIDHSYFKPPPLWKTFWYRSPSVTSQRILLIGIDGTTAQTLNRLVNRKKMPNLEALLRSGARADVRLTGSGLPADGADLLAAVPVFWTSIVTGCSPEVHRLDSRDRVFSTLRRAPALWNINDYFGLRSVVTNVPGTYPAEPLWGQMVSALPDRRPAAVSPAAGDAVPPAAGDAVHLPREPRITYPRSLLAEVQPPDLPYPVNGLHGSPASTAHARWRLAAALAQREDWTLRAHVFTVTGRVQPVSGHDESRDATAVEAYQAIDRQLKSVLAELDERTWLVLVAARGRTPQKNAAGQGDSHLPGDGLLLIAGPGAKPGVHVGQVSPLDVVPTALYALDLPVFEHLQGEVLSHAFSDEFQASHPGRTAPPCAFDRGWEFIDLFGLEDADPGAIR